MSALERFRPKLNPAAVADIVSWTDHAQLRKLLANLEANAPDRVFLNSYAEAMVARELLRGGCDVKFEVPTPLGKQCDFEVSGCGSRFYLHVKRVHTEQAERRKLTVSSRLRYLERINRPYIVSVRWREDMTDEQMQQFVSEAAKFIQHGRVGDEHVVRDEREFRGRELGGCRIVAPWEGTHVSLMIGLPGGYSDETLRMRRLLERAHQQFMPRAVNVILLGSAFEEDIDDFEAALLGSHIERWDMFPPRGRRIAHGRDKDGFWYEGSHIESQAAGWFLFDIARERLHGKLWLRPEGKLDADLTELLQNLLHAE